jgi:glycerol-3-phosphate acyltransferase PlsY
MNEFHILQRRDPTTIYQPDFWMVLLASYLIGSFPTGYLLVRLRTGQDLRKLYSRSTGATNASRILGKTGYLITGAVDVAKGGLAVWLGTHYHFANSLLIWVVLTVVIGHIWSIFLLFAGGKGVAPSLGALLMYHPGLLIGLISLFLLFYLLTRHFVLSGLLAYLLLPLVSLWFFSWQDVILCLLLCVVILIAHRENIISIIKKKKGS